MITREQLFEVLKNHCGADNGMHMRDLAHRLYGPGAGDFEQRQIRKLIVCLRDEGRPICGRPDTGYFLAATPDELDTTCEFLIQRVMTTLQQIARMKGRSIPDLRGQLGLPIDPTLTDQPGETP